MIGTINWDPGDALIFIQVVDEGSFSAASRTLKLPKSTVSRRVSRLESQLGLQLMRRTTRRLSLTEAGLAFFKEASRAAEALISAELLATSILDEPRGRLRITAPSELGTRTFEILLGFSNAYPDLDLDLDLSNQYVDLIEQGFDVALRGGKPPQGTLTGRPLLGGDIQIVASPQYLEEHGLPKRASDLAKHRCILFPSWVHGSAWLLNGPRGKVRIPINGKLTLNNLDGVRQATLQGYGISLMPSSHCDAEKKAGTLVRILPRLSKPSGGMWIVYPRTSYLSAKVRVFVDYVQKAFAETI
ncbi:MAG: LysR family transcriptional regulator [Planctomycetes bacterium]|nr:LysR family transcriptional regulator [Planctomycetota bacterium]